MSSRLSYSQKLTGVVKSVAGLDLVLRLIQAVAQIVADVQIDGKYGIQFGVATSQLALARRYLRFFSFIELFQQVQELAVNPPKRESNLTRLMKMTEYSLLGMYILMEDLTMLHDMGIWLVTWYETVLVEANKLWFYAICISLTRSFMQLSATSEKPPKGKSSSGKKKNKGKDSALPPSMPSSPSVVKRLLVDSCDLTLPASCVRWIAIGDASIGMAMVVSTIIALTEVWESIN